MILLGKIFKILLSSFIFFALIFVNNTCSNNLEQKSVIYLELDTTKHSPWLHLNLIIVSSKTPNKLEIFDKSMSVCRIINTSTNRGIGIYELNSCFENTNIFFTLYPVAPFDSTYSTICKYFDKKKPLFVFNNDSVYFDQLKLIHGYHNSETD